MTNIKLVKQNPKIDVATPQLTNFTIFSGIDPEIHNTKIETGVFLEANNEANLPAKDGTFLSDFKETYRNNFNKRRKRTNSSE